MSLKGDTRKPALENLLSLATFARKPAPPLAKLAAIQDSQRYSDSSVAA